MMKYFNKILLLTLLAVICLSCQEKPKPVPTPNQSQLKESLEKANRYLILEEEEEIQNYVDRHEWNMVATGSGLRYEILQQGEGELIQPGQTVVMEYVLNDIQGDVVYSSENDGLKSFVVGAGGAETGLDEAVRRMRKGTVAHVIIPSHLGYGLLGDQNRIPSYATLVYTIRIKDVR